MNKSEKLGMFLHFCSLIIYLILLIYYTYFSNNFEIFKNLLKINFGDCIGFIYLFVFLVGLLNISLLYYSIMKKIFCPDNDNQIKLKKQISIINKEYRKDRRNIRDIKDKKIKILRLKNKLKELENE